MNPEAETITVLVLHGEAYAPHGVFRRGDLAASVLLAGFAVGISAALDAS